MGQDSHFDAILAHLCAILAHLGAILAHLGAILALSWLILEPILAHPGPRSAQLASILGPVWHGKMDKNHLFFNVFLDFLHFLVKVDPRSGQDVTRWRQDVPR